MLVSEWHIYLCTQSARNNEEFQMKWFDVAATYAISLISG